MSGSEVRWAGHPDDVVLEFRGQRDKTGQRSAQKKGLGSVLYIEIQISTAWGPGS